MIQITKHSEGDFSVTALNEQLDIDFSDPPETVGELVDQLGADKIRITGSSTDTLHIQQDVFVDGKITATDDVYRDPKAELT
jgi:hypothetical protein